MRYAELQVTSHFSFLRGASAPEELFAAAALLTPVATPANLMVQEAAGYRFGDYWRLGLPLLVIYGLAGVFAVPMVWPF